ncbi:MAG: PKD domain-containing protein, partial [Acidimicrobiales bacterium]|nr:PKD domain-containing protein [Acidimicrobiales bacterium]
ALPSAHAQADFVDEPVISNMAVTTSMDWLPDGRALIGSKWGKITLADPANGSASDYFTLDVDSAGERGLLDILVHPNFSQNNYFYAYYSAPNTTRLTIERFTFTGNGGADSGSGVVLWQNPGPTHAQFGQYHIGGSLNIGPDDKFYLTVGDGYDGNNGQDLTTVFGKVLRINQNGSVPASNPFHDAGGPNIDEIWAYGLRNPFRASFDDVTERFFIGDVGGNVANEAYEEVNIGLAGKNYGWALCQGPLGPGNIGPDCPSNVDIEPPIHFYAHDPGGACCQNASITGGEIIRSTALPNEMWGAYVYGDYAQRELRYLTFNPDGSVASDQQLIDLDPQQPVWIDVGPDGHIYYLDFVYGGNNSELRRVRYTGTPNQPPTIGTASASPTSGGAPLTVTFSGAAADPDDDPITYSWDFGDGSSSANPNATHTYAAAGTYTARLTATANGDSVFSDPITIQAGSAPVVTITSPLPTDIFDAGDTLDLSATATDDGPQNELTYRWDVLQVHDDHTHPRTGNNGLSGASTTYAIATDGHDYTGDTSILAIVTVTDGDGLSTVAEVEIEPNRRAIGVESSDPAVSTVRVDGINQSLPFTIDTVTGFEHEIEALDQPCGAPNPRQWAGWSTGAAQVFDYTVPASDETLTADYSTPPCSVKIVPGFVVVTEGDSGTQPGLVPVTLSEPSNQVVTVQWTTVGLYAEAGADFLNASGTVNFQPGQTSKLVNIPIVGDTETETTEYVVAWFHSPTNAQMGGFWGLGFVVIEDDDQATGPVLSVADGSRAEGDSGYGHVGLTVTLSEPSTEPVSFDWSTFDVTANSGSDYDARSGTYTFAPGQTAKTLWFRVYGDNADEGNETFRLVIGDTTGATVAAPGYGTATILNDD